MPEVGPYGISTTMDGFNMLGMTWSKTNERVRYYIDGNMFHTDPDLGAWVGTPNRVVIGATDANPLNPYGGWLQHFALFDTELSEVQMESIGVLS